MPEYFYHVGIEPTNIATTNQSQIEEALQPFTNPRTSQLTLSKHNRIQGKPSGSLADQTQPCSPDDSRIDSLQVEGEDRWNDITAGLGTNLANINTKAAYLPGQGLNTQERGIIHLYRDAEETSGLYHKRDALPEMWSGSATARQAPVRTPTQVNDDECRMLAILAVPSYLTPKDFLAFVGAKTRDAVSHFRMIKTSRLNRYMVLMKFKDGRFARQWQHDWNGRVFNSMEPETCHVVFVKTVEVMQRQVQKPETLPGGSLVSSTKPLAPITPSLVELPTCPVCLERMDESTGLLTILCQHVFHCTCLEKWSGGGCPVCRYSYDDFSTATSVPRVVKKLPGKNGEYDVAEELECVECHQTDALWQCLICGSVGCGRYAGKHAYKHHQATGHVFALDLDTQRVWDYDHDCYVHRIIANGSSSNGEKLVELPGRRQNVTALDESEQDLDVVKRENLAFEYTQLLTSQLESQRVYFEEVVARAVDKASEANKRSELVTSEALKLEDSLQEMRTMVKDMARKLQEMEKECDRHKTRAAKLEALSRELQMKYTEEKTIADSVTANQKMVDTAARDAEVVRLKEQIENLRVDNATKDFYLESLQEERRDLRFQLDSEKTLLKHLRAGTLTLEELEGATISTGPSTGSATAETSSAGNRKKKKTTRADPTEQELEESTLPKMSAEQLMQSLVGDGYKLSDKWTQAEVIGTMLEAGLVEKKEEEGLYEDENEEGSEEGDGSGKKKKRKGRSKKKKKANK